MFYGFEVKDKEGFISEPYDDAENCKRDAAQFCLDNETTLLIYKDTTMSKHIYAEMRFRNGTARFALLNKEKRILKG